jgi:hypothetical protein
MAGDEWDLTDEQAVTWWDGLLRKGFRLNAYGGSDYHRGQDPLIPATRVWISRLEAGAVIDGLRRGRTVMVADPRGPDVELAIGNAKPGDTAPSQASSVEVRLRGAEGLRFVLLTDTGVVQEVESVASNEARQVFAVDLRGRRFVRAELRRGGRTGEMVALTNAIFVR